MVSCGFDAFLVEWIHFTDFNKKINFSTCTCASCVFFVEVGCGRRVVSCGFDAFLVEWIQFIDFNKTNFSTTCTCAPARCQSTAMELTMKAPSLFQRKMLDTTCGMVSPDLTESIGVLAPLPVPRLRPLCDNRIKSLGSCFFPPPLRQDSDLCQDSDPCQDFDTYGRGAQRIEQSIDVDI